MSGNGFLSRLLGRDADEDDSKTYSDEKIEARRPRGRRLKSEEGQPPRDFSVQRVAETIADLPSDVPRESAVLIVRRTLAAAGIELSEIDMSTQEQESKLSSEIQLAQNRQKELRDKTEEAVRSLEEEIRKTQENCNSIVAYEEKKIFRASTILKEVRRVQTFFELPEMEGGEEDTGSADEDTQILEPFEVVDSTPEVRVRSEPLDGTDNTTTYGSAESSSMYDAPSDTSDER